MDHDMLPRPWVGTILLGPPDWVGVVVCGVLVLGAPVTLLLRALPARGPGAAPRRLLIRLLHTRTLRVVSSLPMALALFVVKSASSGSTSRRRSRS